MDRFILYIFSFAQDSGHIIYSPWEAPKGGNSTREAMDCDMSDLDHEHFRSFMRSVSASCSPQHVHPPSL